MHALLAEAQLEVGPGYKDPMHNFGDLMFVHDNDDDDDRYQDSEDGQAPDTLLFSQFLQMAAQQR